jgi:hypothetical protein
MISSYVSKHGKESGICVRSGVEYTEVTALTKAYTNIRTHAESALLFVMPYTLNLKETKTKMLKRLLLKQSNSYSWNTDTHTRP